MTFRKGGGHSNPKNFVADFSTSRKKPQHCFPKRGGVKGRLEFFSSENSSKSENLVIP